MKTSSAGHQWIVSPAFDLVFFANLWWLAALLPMLIFEQGSTTSPLEFWQVYFLTTPHRWLTLLLVSTDPDRRQGRTRLFVWLAVIAAMAVGGTYALTGAFVCLALVDYIWNAWHFGSQHSGILRIYARKAGGGRPGLEHTLVRVFVTYTSMRLAGWTTGWTEAFPMAAKIIRAVDLLILTLPAYLVLLDVWGTERTRVPKLTYLGSVSALYGMLLLAVRDGHTSMVVALTVASAAFHAVEYLAIVTYYANRRQSHGSLSPFRAMSKHWLQVLTAFVVVFGVVGEYGERHWKELWLGLNLWCAFLHYTYDGLIWKLRRPDTAQTMGVELPAPVSDA